MALGLISWLVNGIFVTALTYVGHGTLRGNRRSLNIAEFIFLWIFTATLVMLAVGLAGWLAPVPILAVSMAGLALLVLLPVSRRTLAQVWPELKALGKAASTWWGSIPRWLQWLTLLGAVSSAVRFAFLIVVLPPFVWDSLTYHLTNVAHWTQAGRIELFDTPVLRIYTPANYETFTTWFTVFLHNDVVVEASGLPAYLLAMAATYAAGRGLHLSRKASWLASLTYAFTPALLLAATGTKNDPHMAAYFMTAVAIIIGLVSSDSDRSDSNPLGQLVLLVVVVLYAFGTKAYMLHLIPALLVLGFASAWQRRDLRVWVRRVKSAIGQLREAGFSLRLILLVVVISGVFLGGYWNVRNLILTGNPFYPYGVDVAGSQVLASGDRTAQLNFSRLTANVQMLIGKFGDKKGPIRPDLPGTTGWGWFVYGLGLPALAWSMVRDKRVRLLALAFLTGLLLIFLSDRPSPWNMRYVIWFPALFSFAFATWVDGVSGSHRLLETGYVALMSLTLVLNFAMTANYYVVTPRMFQQMLQYSVWDRQSATLKVNMPPEYENALVYVPNNELLGYNVGSNGFVYPLYRSDFSQHIVYVPFADDASCEDIIHAMEVRHTRYLFVAPEHTADLKIALLQRCSESDSGLRQRARGIYVLKSQPSP